MNEGKREAEPEGQDCSLCKGKRLVSTDGGPFFNCSKCGGTGSELDRSGQVKPPNCPECGREAIATDNPYEWKCLSPTKDCLTWYFKKVQR